MDKSTHTAKDNAAESPVAWFAVLERARETEDFEAAAEAVQQLERLGVKVKFRKPRGARHAD
jgi:hypothetical protein